MIIRMNSSRVILVELLALVTLVTSQPSFPTVAASGLTIENGNGSRIVGGTATSIAAFPYQAGLVYGGQIICGASVIGPTTVLTAAHCIISNSPAAFQVRAGATYRSGSDPLTQVRPVSQLVVHSLYNRNTQDNDIAILRLSTPLTFNSAIQAVALPAQGFDDPPTGSLAVATGWGRTTEGGQVSQELRVVQVPFVSRASCRLAYRSQSRTFFGTIGGIVTSVASTFFSTNITPNMVCAGVAGRDTCQGDSGGPLASASTPRTLIGIASFGIGCARNGYPGVYTKVSAYRSWISANGGV